MHLFGVFSSPWSFVADCCCFCCPQGLVLILYGKRLSFPILVRIWRLAWFLLQVPPSGRTAKRTLEWVAFTPDSEGACGLGIFLFLVRDTPFPSLLSLHCPPAPHKEPVCLCCTRGCPPATSGCQDSQEVAHRPQVPLSLPFPPDALGLRWAARWQCLR